MNESEKSPRQNDQTSADTLIEGHVERDQLLAKILKEAQEPDLFTNPNPRFSHKIDHSYRPTKP